MEGIGNFGVVGLSLNSGRHSSVVQLGSAKAFVCSEFGVGFRL